MVILFLAFPRSGGMRMDLNLVVAGEAGQGLQTLYEIMSKALFRQGYSIFGSKDYMSRIRGGHNFMQIRVSDKEINSPAEEVDLLIALSEEGKQHHAGRVKESGVILLEENGKIRSDAQVVSLPAESMAEKINPRAVNTVFLGAAWKLLGFSLGELRQVIKERFTDPDIQSDNLKLLEKGHEEVSFSYSGPPPPEREEERLLLDGNQAVALGAAVSDVQFYSAYPMTPSTGILNFLASHQEELGIAVEQAEDEIAAINMALGASYAGVRAMTGTSGGGFSLMVEGFGLAGVMEAPIVIAEVQRPGPATGMPTRTEQGDLSFVINSHQGEFPLKVIAPRTQEEAFYQTVRAFNLAEKYQIPVVILSDQFLADSKTDMKEIELEELSIRRNILDENSWPEDRDYKRYEITESGISPRAYPGQMKDDIVLQDSHEHDEYGFIEEGAEKRKRMVEKRMRKLTMINRKESAEPVYYGPSQPEYLMAGWGSTYGPMREARRMLADEDISIGMLSFCDVWPLPTAELEKNRTYSTTLATVENNATGQLASLISAESGLTIDHRVLKYNGRPFTAGEIYRRIKREVIA